MSQHHLLKRAPLDPAPSLISLKGARGPHGAVLLSLPAPSGRSGRGYEACGRRCENGVSEESRGFDAERVFFLLPKSVR